ncbi:MAG: hypothetical protein LQ342_002352 [Letrouitia transgressa]|nr:MAG: hypothetical protein LQ342_002352 [Letrouitia transgressa]
MRSAFILPALVGLTLAIPKPQLIDTNVLENHPDPVLVSAPFAVARDDPPDVDTPPIEPITTSPLETGQTQKRDVAPPPPIYGFDGPTSLDGAINAPQYNGKDTYLGRKFFPFDNNQGFDPIICAKVCRELTDYNRHHRNKDGTWQTCIFFNAYVQTLNDKEEGQYCTSYSKAWAPSYATNYGQTRNNNRYGVSRSVSYSLQNPPNPPTTSPSPQCINGPFIANGGFESSDKALTSWSVNTIGNASSTIIHPGFQSQNAMGALLYSSPETGVASLSLSQNLTVCAGYNYYMRVVSRFGHIGSNNCELYAYVPTLKGRKQVYAADAIHPSWDPEGFTYLHPAEFRAVPGNNTLEFVAKCKNGATNGVFIDGVEIKWEPSYVQDKAGVDYVPYDENTFF